MTTGGDRSAVLIVEDDEATAELERRALARAGTTAVIVSRVKDALEHLDKHSFAAIFLDYPLPDGDPWAVLEAANAKHPRIPVVIVTGLDIASSEWANSLGASGTRAQAGRARADPQRAKPRAGGRRG